jgi:uncharacterized protein (TIGR03437 family)
VIEVRSLHTYTGNWRVVEVDLITRENAIPVYCSLPYSAYSPVEVTVNRKAAEVLSAVGFPGAFDGYQVNFRVAPATAKGPAAIQVAAAWISGAPVSIQVQ